MLMLLARSEQFGEFRIPTTVTKDTPIQIQIIMLPPILSISPRELSPPQPISSSSNLYPISTFHWVALSSLPMLGGAYVGYRMELSRIAVSEAAEAEKNLVQHTLHGRSTPPLTIRPVNGPLLALKAFGIGTMLSIGGVALLTAAVFRAHGCSTLEELIMIWREWAPRKRKELLEDSWGIRPKSMQHEDVLATRGFSEDEEWNYVKRKYIPELVEESEKK